jgi:23S rRNA pseudouridine1911/1915/1917 synthase
VDGGPASPGSVLRRGQSLAWHRPPWDEPPAPVEIDVVYEDAALLAVNKPAGLPTLPGAGFLEQTLLHRIRERFPGAAPVHRLGRFTSGLVLCGRSDGARAALTRQWAERAVEKRYRALAAGNPTWQAMDIAVPIGPVPHPILGTVHAASAAGKPACSRIAVVERRGEDCLCDVRIDTGRPHQIRIHLAAAGHPLRGDPLYVAGGLPDPRSTAVPGDPGYDLHAAALAFRHPETGARLEVACAPPPRLCAAAD